MSWPAHSGRDGARRCPPAATVSGRDPGATLPGRDSLRPCPPPRRCEAVLARPAGGSTGQARTRKKLAFYRLKTYH